MNTDYHPVAPIRWYEHLLLRFLARSPRIQRLIVVQEVLEETARLPEPVDYPAYAEYLNLLYYSPSADRYAE
jgi:hypothetical protein